MLAIITTSVEVVVVDITMEGVQSVANKTADGENKCVVWHNNRGNKHMLLTSFSVVAMYHHNVLENSAVAAIVVRRWQAVGSKFWTMRPQSTCQ